MVYRLIKFKCRGASILGIVAQDEMQSYVKAWTKKFNLNDPLMVEVVVIKGSLQSKGWIIWFIRDCGIIMNSMDEYF